MMFAMNRILSPLPAQRDQFIDHRGSRALQKFFPMLLLIVSAGCEQAHVPTTLLPPILIPCDLNSRPCELNSQIQKQKITLALSPRPVPVLDPITVDLNFDAPSEANATVALVGIEMDMGINTIKLQRLTPKTMQGKLVIPICLSGTMKWALTLTLQHRDQEERFQFNFSAPLRHPVKIEAQETRP